MSDKDRYATPDHIFNAVMSELNVRCTWDVCAEEWSSKAGLQFFGPGSLYAEDALAICWRNHIPGDLPVVWCNPPYSALADWTSKCAGSSFGMIVVGCVPDMRSSKWFQESVEGVASLCLLPDGRINFTPPDGIRTSSNPWPTCFPVWTPWRTGATQYRRFKRK